MPPERFLTLKERVVRMRNIRQRTAGGWTGDEFTTAACRAPLSDADVAVLLSHFHLQQRATLLADSLDALDIPHRHGLAERGAFEEAVPRIRADTLHHAVTHCLDRHERLAVLLYLLTLRALHPPLQVALDAALPTLPAPASVSPGVAGETAVTMANVDADDAASGETVEPSFTALDRMLIRGVVDAAEGVEGALGEEQLEDAVREVLQLNSTRHQSYFHTGFFDGLFGRSYRTHGLAVNHGRRRWYAAGYVGALARRDEADAIVALFYDQASVRELGGADDTVAAEAARMTADLIIDALCRHNRGDEAARFVAPPVLRLNNRGALRLHEQATLLLRGSRPDVARVIFDRLVETVPDVSRASSGQAGVWRSVHRRRANCYRQLGDLETARARLEALLPLETDDLQRHRMLVDLGLIASGYRNLADVRLPVRADQVPDVLHTLELGHPQFTQALEVASHAGGHAQYCLGLMALMRQEYVQAVELLREAYAEFRADPTSYRHGGLLSYSQMALGVALCLAGERGQTLVRAASLLRDAVDEHAGLPEYLVEDVIVALMDADDDVTRGFVEAELRRNPDRLELLLGVDAARHSQVIGDALRVRMLDAKLSITDRARIARSAFDIFKAQHRFDDASDALDVADEAALRGEDATWLREVLADPGKYDPVWSHEEALGAHCRVLVATQRFDEAEQLLRAEFFRVVDGSADDRVYALGIAERLDEVLACVHRGASDLRAILAARDGQDDWAPPAPSDTRVRILVIGGDERQSPYEAPLREELAATRPDIDVDFFRTGWSSNWGDSVREVEHRLERGVDAVVLMQFMRTGFGRTVRRIVGSIPWRPCTGHGRESIRRSIECAADAAHARAT